MNCTDACCGAGFCADPLSSKAELYPYLPAAGTVDPPARCTRMKDPSAPTFRDAELRNAKSPPLKKGGEGGFSRCNASRSLLRGDRAAERAKKSPSIPLFQRGRSLNARPAREECPCSAGEDLGKRQFFQRRKPEDPPVSVSVRGTYGRCSASKEREDRTSAMGSPQNPRHQEV